MKTARLRKLPAVPGSIHAESVVDRAVVVERLLDICLEPQRFPVPPTDLEAAVDELHRMVVT